MFGRFTSSNRRPELFSQLSEYVEELRKTGKIDHVIVNGSFVTDKERPSDVDLIVALKEGMIPDDSWTVWEWNLISRRWVRRKYGLDILVDRFGATEYDEHVEYFFQVKEVPGMTKGLVRVSL